MPHVSMGRPSMVWHVNRIANALVILVGLLVFAFLVVRFVSSLVNPDADVHGYARIFSVILGVVLLVPLGLLALAARALRRNRLAGFGYQAFAGVAVGLYALPVPAPAGWIGVGLGGTLVVLGLTGLVTTRRT